MTERLSIAPGLYQPPRRGRVQRVARADRTDADGTVFDSKSEMQRWHQLKLMQLAGEISGLDRQKVFVLAYDGRPVKIRSPRYPNGRECTYTVDFVYRDNSTNQIVYEDTKGFYDDGMRFKIAVVEAMYQIRITITGNAKLAKKRSGSRILARKGG